MVTRGRAARSKGCNFERQIAQEMRELGWSDCATSRYSSKETDDAKVDLVNTFPFNFQCKAWESTVPYLNVLESMPKDENINIILHKKKYKVPTKDGKGTKLQYKEIAILTKDHLYDIIKKYIKTQEGVK